MKKKAFVIFGLSAVLALSPLTVFAGKSVDSSIEQKETPPEMEGVTTEEVLAFFKEVLDDEVNQGTITQQEADEKYTAMEQQKIPFMLPQENETLTEEERLSHMKEMLAKEVADGKLTQEEADTKYEQLESGEKPEKQDRTEMTQMTEEERLASMKERLDQEVANGKLTQEEADTKYEQFESGEKPEFDAKSDKNEMMSQLERIALTTKIVNKQLELGVITQEEADSMLEKINNNDFPKGGRPENREPLEV